MTKEEREWFDKLVKDREENARVLEKQSMKGVKKDVTEKYPDFAHFVYELLQNADDAKATKCKFRLERTGLYFIHNGTEHFCISNPETESIDSANNKLGHINSITSVGSSTKENELSTIGKFGVGFKAVFQYTEEPEIYDAQFKFKIIRFVVPQELKDDLNFRNSEETVFYFPFNKEGMPAEKAYSDILTKLKTLLYPTLFLSYLQEVTWNTDSNETGEYRTYKGISNHREEVSYVQIELYQQIDLEQTTEKLLLFSRRYNDFDYYVGFFLDDNNKLKPQKLKAFCFFPTEEATELNFIIHAPFILNNSRASIPKNQTDGWNESLIEKLAELAADSLPILKEEGFITDEMIRDIIPYKKSDFYEGAYKENAKFFAPFYEKIKTLLQSKDILPSLNGTFTNSENAYWASAPNLPQLFSNEQLSILYDNGDAKWMFPTLGYDNLHGTDKELAEYIYDLTNNLIVKPEIILKKINSDFTVKQSFDWLHKLYEYLSLSTSYQGYVKTSAIFVDSNGNAVSAFTQDVSTKQYQNILFFPTDYSSENIIHADLLKNEKSKEFFNSFGIRKPDRKDGIIKICMGTAEDISNNFSVIFQYYKDSRDEDFIDLLKAKPFVKCKDGNSYEASELYYPSDDLILYFETKQDTKFVDLNELCSLSDENDFDKLKTFLLLIGVKEYPIIIEQRIWSIDGIIDYDGNKLGTSSRYKEQNTYDKIIDGCEEILDSISKEKSILLWKFLSQIHRIKYKLSGLHTYYCYNQYTQSFESSVLKLLRRDSKWLVNKDGTFVAPNEITIDVLSDEYDKSNQQLVELLRFKQTVDIEKVLTPVQLYHLKWGELIGKHLDLDLAEQKLTEQEEKEIENAIERTVSEIIRKRENPPIEEDEKELADGIEKLKKELEQKKDRKNMVDSINKNSRYSYVWFEAYLKLLKSYGEKQSSTSQKSIIFERIKPYKDDNKYFLLFGTSQYVSSDIEDAEDFNINLVYKSKSRKKEQLKVEGVSKKGQDLLIYSREPKQIECQDIVSIEIRFTPVIDLLDRLYKAFTNRDYINEWEDIKDALPQLRFIYGPPGTGKTTFICKTINHIISENPTKKFLILTPTNKAADVVCKKLWNLNPDIFAIRLGHPTDPELEEEAIYRDTISEADLRDINVVASTVHRLPYFDVAYYGKLFQVNWDYVIFDESSMTGLHYMVFALMSICKTNPNTEFIIAGDPKQIPPIIDVNDNELENFEFQDENIYKMLELSSFKPEEQKIRQIDTIQNLDTQWRSVPQIGTLFSKLSYSSLLKHGREENRKDVKTLPAEFKNIVSSSVTFIDLPLSQDNSTYKIDKLLYSSYHTYSAILISEIIKYFDKVNKDEQWTIGVIAPYKAQAVLMNKLLTSFGLSENLKIYADTVHGFQGDECDIVFFVCNPNNYYYTGHEKCLLSKEYIYNVAISRAKDYLVVLHPFSTIQNNMFINSISEAYRSNFGNPTIKPASDIEAILFNDTHFIENNCYSTGHDNVNVFGYSEMKYFVKANNNAIDIQINMNPVKYNTDEITARPLKPLERATIVNENMSKTEDSRRFIIERQRQWAAVRGLRLVGSQGERGERNYTAEVGDNLFCELSASSRAEIGAGDGNELTQKDGAPCKMQALHSSSALGVNVFEYWKQAGQAEVIAEAMGLLEAGDEPSRIVFEDKYPIHDSFTTCPNIDVVIHNALGSAHQRYAVECKFTEAYYGQGHSGMKEQYLNPAFVDWSDLPRLRRLAEKISPDDNDYLHLHPAQLIKHILGLRRKFGKCGFKLLYLWYDVPNDDGARHRAEAEEFQALAHADGIAFSHLTYQELIVRLAEALDGRHSEYVTYLKDRYL